VSLRGFFLGKLQQSLAGVLLVRRVSRGRSGFEGLVDTAHMNMVSRVHFWSLGRREHQAPFRLAATVLAEESFGSRVLYAQL